MEMQMPGGHLLPPVQKLAVSLLSAKGKGSRFPYPSSAHPTGALLFLVQAGVGQRQFLSKPGASPNVHVCAVSFKHRWLTGSEAQPRRSGSP